MRRVRVCVSARFTCARLVCLGGFVRSATCRIQVGVAWQALAKALLLGSADAVMIAQLLGVDSCMGAPPLEAGRRQWHHSPHLCARPFTPRLPRHVCVAVDNVC